MKKYLQQEMEYFKNKIKNLPSFDKSIINSFTENEKLQELIQSFMRMIVELREDIEGDIPVILQQIYSHLYGKNLSNIAKAIICINPDPYYTSGIFLNENNNLVSDGCYFSLMESITLWPLKIKKQEFIKCSILKDIKCDTSHVLKITISSLNIPIKKMDFNHLRFFINGTNASMFLKDLFLNETTVVAYVVDGQQNKLKDMSRELYSTCNVTWPKPKISEGIEILKDYATIPEIYQFINLENIDLSNIFNDLCVYIPINLSQHMDITLFLGCVVIKNIYKTQTDPFKISLENLQQKITINSFKKNLLVHVVNKCFLMKQGVATNLPCDNNRNWCSFNRGTDTFICFLNDNMNFDEWAYCEVTAHNGEAVNVVNLNSEAKLEEYNNLFCNFLIPPNYSPVKMNMQELFEYINTDYKYLLSNEETLKEVLNNILNVYESKFFVVIENIKIKSIVSHKKWGKNFVPVMGKDVWIDIKSNMPDPLIFLKILHEFLVEFSTVNIFINLSTEWRSNIYTIKENIND
jgi:type VI protein secretion system component VasA